MIKVALADDHDLFVEGLSSLLIGSGEIDVVVKASNGKQLIDLLYENYAEVLLLDIDMPKLDGKGALEIINENWPKLKVLMLTMHDEVAYIEKFLSLPINGYLLKDTDGYELVEAIKWVNEGDKEQYIPDKVRLKLEKANREKERADNPVNKLSTRELEIVKLTAKDWSIGQISDELGISYNTIKTHRKNILRKLELNSSIGITKFAIENGLV
jgi:DNA-binding NarL/FixJ family response regulator